MPRLIQPLFRLPRFPLLLLLASCGGLATTSTSERLPDAAAPAQSPTPQPPAAQGGALDASLISFVDNDASDGFNTGPPPLQVPCVPPLPGCTSNYACPEGDGVTMCTCAEGVVWQCSMPVLDDGGLEPGRDGVCEANLPEEGSPCNAPSNVDCRYGFCWVVRCVSGAWDRGSVCLPGPSPPPPGP